MKNKMLKKIISLLTVFVLLAGTMSPVLEVIPGVEANAGDIASFGGNAGYRWKWTLCKSMADLKATGILNTTYTSVSALKLDYTFVLVSGNRSTQYYFTDLPDDDEEYNWSTGNAADTVFDVNGDGGFCTKEFRSSSYIVYHSGAGDTSAAFDLFKADSGYVSYLNGKITKSGIGNIYGLANASDTDFSLKKNSRGESFTFTFDATRANGSGGNVRIIETDSTSYHWASYDDDKSYGETKKSRGDDEYFFLWIGHYEAIDGLGSGDYNIKADTLLCDDSQYALITSDAVLTIQSGATLTVKGKLYVEGEINNYGNIIIEDGGELLLGIENTCGKICNYDYTETNRGNFVIAKGGKASIYAYMNIRKLNGTIQSFEYSMINFNDATFVNNGTLNMLSTTLNFSFSGMDFKNCGSGAIMVPSGVTADLFKHNYMKTYELHSFVNDGYIYSGSNLISL